ncbi:hypothetical protein [Agathobaculum sp.]|uniref:hypothetical protein n=1 Tax=Agathobaculum sp. TaxID=2048138 RepID=UPI003AB1E386
MATIQQVERMLQEPHAYGIHTMQVKSIEFLPSEPKAIQWLWGRKDGEKHYKLNTCQFIHQNSYTLVDAAQMPSALHKMTEGAELYVERVDFAFDNYVYPYDTFFPLNTVLAQLFAQVYSLTNNGLTVQVPLDGKLIKDFFVKYNKYGTDTVLFEISYYQKILQYPASGINGRLELRCLDAGGTVLEGIQRIIRLLDGACTRENYDALIQDQTDKLRAEWARMRARRLSVPHCTPLWLDNNRLRIISTEQLYALLYELRPGIDAHALVRRYNAARDENERLTRCNLVSFDKLTKYVTLLRKHLYLYARKYKYSLSQLPKCNKKPLKADQGKERLSENSDDELFR